MSALAISNLSLSFGGVQALDRVSFSVEAGERRLVIGPNGAGKTTLFNVISGIFPASTGEIVLFDQNIMPLSVHARARLGVARTFQITNLFRELTVFENVLLAVQAVERIGYVLHRPAASYRQLHARVDRVLHDWGLQDTSHTLVNHLSYGEQRQIDLILALVGSPRVLLLDEPLSGLSAAESAQVVGILNGLPRDMTILMIEHDMDVALELADRITVLHLGRTIAEGSAASVRADPRVNEIYLGVEQ